MENKHEIRKNNPEFYLRSYKEPKTDIFDEKLAEKLLNKFMSCQPSNEAEDNQGKEI